MWTPDGRAWLLALAATQLESVFVIVSDGTEVAEAQATEVSVSTTEIRVAAAFGEQEANFEWSAHGLRIGDQRIVWTPEDQGRKAPGSVWTQEVVLTLQEPGE